MHSTQMPVVRRAVAADRSAVLSLIDALADYEKLPRPTTDAQQRLMQDLFGPKPRIDCHLAFLDGYPVGYTIVYEAYSSFLAKPTLFLEDLFVLPEYRSRKAGYSLFQAVLEEAKHRNCGRVEWTVLDWNQLAIDFYQKIGGEHIKEWQLYRMVL